MKIIHHIILIMMLGSFSACTNADVRSWSEQQIDTWYEKSCWNGMNIQLRCMNKRMFVEQNILNPKVWKSAYEFLSSQNLTELPEGRIDLPVGNAYVTVTDYITKDDADFEFHREYIDLQYVASGCEYIYTTSTEDVKEYTQMYDKKTDIGFFRASQDSVFLASPKDLIVLFPSDGHKPCIKVKDNLPVRKIVIKIPVVK